MPEGDTLFKIAGYLRRHALGQLVVGAQLLAAPAPELTRRRILFVEVHGKHLLIGLSPPSALGWCLRVHLGMHGAWHAYPFGARWQRPAWQASVVLDVGAAGTFVCFAAEDVALSRPPKSAPTLPGLGPQLLRRTGAPDGSAPPTGATRRRSPWAQQLAAAALDIDLLDIIDRLYARRADTLACDLLLDQRLAAGFGNVYKSELLFLFRIAPTCPLERLSPWLLASVFARGRALLEQNVGGWPRTTTVDRRRVRLPRGLPRLWVYNRAGAPCLVCGTALCRAALGRHRRATFWCSHCQPAQITPPAHRIARIHVTDVWQPQALRTGALRAR